MGVSRQEYWSGLPFFSPGDVPNPGTQNPTKVQELMVPNTSGTTVEFKPRTGSQAVYELLESRSPPLLVQLCKCHSPEAGMPKTFILQKVQNTEILG